MIELSWKALYENHNVDLMYMSNLLAWLTATIVEEQKSHAIMLTGFICINDEENKKLSALILCEGESQEKILTILKNPPGEFKEKYIACIVASEPMPVTEVLEEEDEESDALGKEET